MRNIKKDFLVFMLPVLLIGNLITVSWLIPSAKADVTQALNPGSVPNVAPNIGINLQSLPSRIVNQATINQASTGDSEISQCPNGPNPQQVAVVVTKSITPSSSSFAGQPFTVQASDANSGNAAPSFPVSVTSQLELCFSTGNGIQILETGPTIGPFSPGSAIYVATSSSGTNSGTTTGNGCEFNNVQLGTTATCSITNPTGQGTSTLIAPSTTSAPVQQTGVQTQGLISLQGILGSSSTSEATSQQSRLTNPPFQTCAANSVAGNVIQAGSGTGTNPIAPGVSRIPSAATYVVAGSLPLGKLRNALSTFGTNTFTIALKSQLNPDNGPMLAIANPQFVGEAIVNDQTGAKQKVIEFRLNTIRTECKFITLAEAVGPAPNENVAPLGQLGKIQPNTVTAPDFNKELIGGNTLSTNVGGFFPASLNSPFATCQTQQTQTVSIVDQNGNVIQQKPAQFTPDNLAIYIITGRISNPQQISGNTLTIQLTADLVQSNSDLAKIVKANNNQANNPFLIANLIANEGKNSAHKIDYTLLDVNTDCKQISLNLSPIFRPITGELTPAEVDTN